MQNSPNASVDLVFALSGTTIPQDHGYAVYAAVSRIVAGIHSATNVGIFPIAAISGGERLLNLTRRSTLRVRAPAPRIPEILLLAGKTLDLDGHHVRVGVPHVALLVPAPLLASPLVTIKLAQANNDDGFVTPDAFLAAAKKKLEERGIRGEIQLRTITSGPRAGQARRRVIRIKSQTHVGYAIVVGGLTPDESIHLQENGLGGRRLMGCGLFLPTPSRGQDT